MIRSVILIVAVLCARIGSAQGIGTVVVHSGAGSFVDTSAREIAHMLVRSGQNFMIVNSPGRIINTDAREHACWEVATDAKLFPFYLDPDNSDKFAVVMSGRGGFDPSFLVEDSNSRVRMLGLGWVPFFSANLKSPGECGPPEDWRDRDGDPINDCMERDGDTFTIKMKVGHPGYSVLELAAPNSCRLTFEEYQSDMENWIEFLEEPELTNALSNRWVLTSIDNGREVIFELYKPGDSEPAKTATGDKAKPVRVSDETSSNSNDHPRNTCGSQRYASACPMFFNPEDSDDWEELRRLVNSIDWDDWLQ